jgi:hypothetical protein
VELWRSFSLLQDFLDSRSNKSVQLVTERITKHGVNDQSLSPKESIHPDALGSIDDLVRDDEMSRFNLFSEGSDGRECDNSLDSDMLESGNVGPGGNFGGGDSVGCTVSGDEGDLVTRGKGGDGDGG